MHLPGFWSMFLILGVALLLFGGNKLPQLGTGMGEFVRNFKKGLKEGDKPIADGLKVVSKHDELPKTTEPEKHS